MSIGKNIQNIRKEKGMTLQQIANIMGCSPQLISQYENGKRIPKLKTIRKIATALGVYISDLVDDWSKFSQEEIIDDFSDKVTDALKNATVNTSTSYGDPEKSERMDRLFNMLNDTGQDKAIEHIELLTKVPEYRKEDNVAHMMPYNGMPYANMLDAGNETYASEQDIPEFEPKSYNEQKKEGNWFKEPQE
ncbi:MAG TPA: hypothetical protein DCZ91_00710 [Lachnospiraceae bacterium]|nr:hypothetical protein [Lachnospiraceae bacterium]